MHIGIEMDLLQRIGLKMLDADEIQILDFNPKPDAADSCTLFISVKILSIK